MSAKRFLAISLCTLLLSVGVNGGLGWGRWHHWGWAQASPPGLEIPSPTSTATSDPVHILSQNAPANASGEGRDQGAEVRSQDRPTTDGSLSTEERSTTVTDENGTPYQSVPLPESATKPAIPIGEDPAAETTPDTATPEAAAIEAEAQAAWETLAAQLTSDQKLLMAADTLYLAGNQPEATQLYRQAKDPQWVSESSESTTPRQPAPMVNPEDLSPAGSVYWREAQEGIAKGSENRTLVSLKLLVEAHPEFVPGQAQYARSLVQYGRLEDAAAVMERAISLYPSQPDLLKAQIDVLMAQEKWLEASITGRQFLILNPDNPDNEAMFTLATQNLDRFRHEMNIQLQRNLVANIVTGAAGYALTGGLFAPFAALDSTIAMLQGESMIGARIADQAQQVLPMMADPEVLAYVDSVGQKMAQVAGRDEFEYDFYVVMDESLNAFALPGGKIFVHAGALEKTESEAELAGLLAHEISHAALSHGFQLVTSGNLTASLASFIPVPEVANLAAGLLITNYSRQMERQADILGTQILATGGYAADGLHNLMITLNKENAEQEVVSWFASHPSTDERVAYLKRLVEQGGYNRYAYEGVESHLKMRARTTALMAEYKRQHPDPNAPESDGAKSPPPESDQPQSEQPEPDDSTTPVPEGNTPQSPTSESTPTQAPTPGAGKPTSSR